MNRLVKKNWKLLINKKQQQINHFFRIFLLTWGGRLSVSVLKFLRLYFKKFKIENKSKKEDFFFKQPPPPSIIVK